MRGLAILLFSLFFATPATAQSPTRFATSPDAPIVVSGQTIILQELKNRALLNGNAKLLQGDLSMTATTMTIIFNPKQGDQAQDVFASNGVSVVDVKGQISHADEAHYNVAAETLELTGNVRVENHNPDAQLGTAQGQRLMINMRDGTSQIYSNAGSGRARIQLKP
jgi:lipopolysaccharide export system protein LptA